MVKDLLQNLLLVVVVLGIGVLVYRFGLLEWVDLDVIDNTELIDSLQNKIIVTDSLYTVSQDSLHEIVIQMDLLEIEIDSILNNNDKKVYEKEHKEILDRVYPGSSELDSLRAVYRRNDVPILLGKGR